MRSDKCRPTCCRRSSSRCKRLSVRALPLRSRTPRRWNPRPEKLETRVHMRRSWRKPALMRRRRPKEATNQCGGAWRSTAESDAQRGVVGERAAESPRRDCTSTVKRWTFPVFRRRRQGSCLSSSAYRCSDTCDPRKFIVKRTIIRRREIELNSDRILRINRNDSEPVQRKNNHLLAGICRSRYGLRKTISLCVILNIYRHCIVRPRAGMCRLNQPSLRIIAVADGLGRACTSGGA